MTFRLAHDEYTLEHGGNTVILRPSLRAASYLEAKYGFTTLFRHVDEFNLATIRDIILAASQARQDAAAFLQCIAGKPLSLIQIIVAGPVADLCRAFIPAAEPNSKPASGKPMPWPDVYRELYRTATGWLHWTPSEAWAATPTEINEAFAGHIAMLKAIHGSADDKPAHDPREEVSADEVRTGLAKLKASAKRGTR